MILIDLSKQIQTIVFYSAVIEESIFSLRIKAESGTKTFQFQLSDNKSPDYSRSFIFELLTVHFEDLQVGLYDYEIITSNDFIATKGKLMIRGNQTVNDVTPDYDEEDEIIFNG